MHHTIRSSFPSHTYILSASRLITPSHESFSYFLPLPQISEFPTSPHTPPPSYKNSHTHTFPTHTHNNTQYTPAALTPHVLNLPSCIMGEVLRYFKLYTGKLGQDNTKAIKGLLCGFKVVDVTLRSLVVDFGSQKTALQSVIGDSR